MTVALFVGKFQPPHIGHVMTIVRIYGDYEKIIIGVADFDSFFHPKIFDASDIVKVFQHVFKYMNKIEVVTYKQSLMTLVDLSQFPRFDEVVTGNRELIKALKGSVEVRYISRSSLCGYDISGTIIRKVLGYT